VLSWPQAVGEVVSMFQARRDSRF